MTHAMTKPIHYLNNLKKRKILIAKYIIMSLKDYEIIKQNENVHVLRKLTYFYIKIIYALPFSHLDVSEMWITRASK